MITDPVEHDHVAWLQKYRVTRGVHFSANPQFFGLIDAATRNDGHADRRASGRGLRLSLTLLCNGAGSVVEWEQEAT